jgi:molecular chaperone GrpE
MSVRKMGKKKEMHTDSAENDNAVSEEKPVSNRRSGGGPVNRHAAADETSSEGNGTSVPGTEEIDIEYLDDDTRQSDDFDPPVPGRTADPVPLTTADASVELSEAQTQIETLMREKSEMQDKLLRRQAEFENFRKRFDRERSEIYQRTRAEVLLELLPVLDNFERALISLETTGDDAEALHQGVTLIHKQLKDAVTKMGLQPVESVGKSFDPNVHEAITVEPSDEHEENTIIEEFQRGYKLGDRLLRPARVKVAGAPER